MEAEALVVEKLRHNKELLLFCIYNVIYHHQTSGRELEV